ncbi:MAG TPA: polyprenyl synthetase family protein, partial [Tissierellaceae bacterium]|nr:polyprenyl synthetase family protein [Tissierellaceae bacterium]
ASPREVKILREYAQVLGLSYQLQDDLLDIEEDESINKFTYLSFYDKDKAEEDIERLCKESFDLLDKLDGRDTQFLKELTELLVNRKK